MKLCATKKKTSTSKHLPAPTCVHSLAHSHAELQFRFRHYESDCYVQTTEASTTAATCHIGPSSFAVQTGFDDGFYSAPDISANYQLLDRIVNVRQEYSVPLGAHGTVSGFKKA